MNIIVVILDSMRQDHLGAYGNSWIQTTHLDLFAREGILFTNCYPESLPTLPFRRSIQTGIRTFPFYDHTYLKGDFEGAPGWGPIPEYQDTLSEILRRNGYRTSFITDTYHYFKPSKNFHRGFDEWQWIRGHENDPYRSGPPLSEERIGKHINTYYKENVALKDFLTKYLQNQGERRLETDYTVAKVFMEASRWIWQNRDAEKFFLLIDSFDPHEPWDPPDYYRKLYQDRYTEDENDASIIGSLYDTWEGKITPSQLKRLQANYAGNVTMVDHWFGFFFDNLRLTGLLNNTLILVISDHGHALGYDPKDKGQISKQGHPMTQAVADLVCILRHPQGTGAGSTFDGFIYNHDLTRTLFERTGIKEEIGMDGIDYWPSITSFHGTKGEREHVTIAWGPLITVINSNWWYNANVWGEDPLLYSMKEDKHLENNLSKAHPDVCKKMLSLAIKDMGGSIPEHFTSFKAMPGCTPFLSRKALLTQKGIDANPLKT